MVVCVTFKLRWDVHVWFHNISVTHIMLQSFFSVVIKKTGSLSFSLVDEQYSALLGLWSCGIWHCVTPTLFRLYDEVRFLQNQIVWRHFPEDRNLSTQRSENLKSDYFISARNVHQHSVYTVQRTWQYRHVLNSEFQWKSWTLKEESDVSFIKPDQHISHKLVVFEFSTVLWRWMVINV
jgi:hypothetical protein